MSKQMEPELFDDVLADDADFALDDWTLDDGVDGVNGAELSSLRSAWAGSNDRFE